MNLPILLLAASLTQFQPAVPDLDLTPAQTADAIALMFTAQGFRADAARELERLAQAIDAELAADIPDLRGLTADIELTIDGLMAEYRQLRSMRLEFYEAMSPEQQQQVARALEQRWQQLRTVAEAMREVARMLAAHASLEN